MARLQDIPNIFVERDKHPHELCTRVVRGFPTVRDVELILRQNKSNRTTRQAHKKLKLWELHLTQRRRLVEKAHVNLAHITTKTCEFCEHQKHFHG